MAISKIVQNSLDTDSISLGPKIRSVQIANSTYVVKDDTAVNTGGGYIVITGSGFTSNSTVLIGSNSACSVTFISATQLRAQIPSATPGSYPVYVVTGDGGTAIRVNALTYSDSPIWVTTSPLTGQTVETAFSIQLSATGANTYVLQTGSTLPSGVSLAANGLLSGTVTGIDNDTTYNFTVEAIDAENQESPKALAVTVTGQYVTNRSLRFNSADSAYLSRTPASSGSATTVTFSFWVKKSQVSAGESNRYPTLYSSGINWSSTDTFTFNPDDKLTIFLGGGTTSLITTQVFRDPSAWYHIVLAIDTTQATSSNRIKMYVNGVQVTAFDTAVYPTLNYNFPKLNNSSNVQGIGYAGNSGATEQSYFAGYMAEIHFVDGTALTPSSFGKFDNTQGGVWVPKTVSGLTYGTNGFYLPFSDNTSTTTLGNDGTANNNDWTLNNFSVTAGAGNDSLVDSPTPNGIDDGSGADVKGSYAVLNPADKGSAITLTNGGLNFSITATQCMVRSTVGMSTGKWYWEYTIGTSGAFTPGIDDGTANRETDYVGESAKSYGMFGGNGNKYNNNNALSYGVSYTDGDTISVAFNADTGTIWFAKNGTWMNSATTQEIINGTTTNSAYTGITPTNKHWYVAVGGGQAGSCSGVVNFGQRPFAYTAPTGYECLVSQNIDPQIAANSSTTLANSYFGTVLYTADTPGGKSITGWNFNPDLIWIKNRDNVENHYLYDTVRGILANTSMSTNLTNAEYNLSGITLGTTTGGITISDTNYESGELYYINRTYVAWGWKAGNSNVTNNNGTKTSTVRANQTAGFSIVTYTGDGATAGTVGHGLGVKPSFIIVKNRSASGGWVCWHKGLTGSNENDRYVYLNSDAVSGTTSNYWGTGGITSSVFGTWTTGGDNNNSGSNFVAYVWAEIEGFSKFGRYTGNGSTEGPFVYTGFRPAFILTKNVTTGGYWWEMVDTGRSPLNPTDKTLYANVNDSEYTSSAYNKDILSNGFKIRGTSAGHNSSGDTFIYMAFAESPFKNARAR
jgi:hypothetical protein